MPLAEWLCALAAALDVEYERRQWEYLLAGGDGKKWPSRPTGGSGSSREAIDSIMRFGKELARRGAVVRGSIHEVAKLRGLQKVFKTPDGKYIDAEGNEVKVPEGHVFFPAGH